MHAVFTGCFLTTLQEDFAFTGLPANQELADSIRETIVTAQKTLVLPCEHHHTATAMELLDERLTLEKTLKSQGNQPDSYFAVA